MINLRGDLVALDCRHFGRTDLQLGIRLRHDLEEAIGRNHRISPQAQRGNQQAIRVFLVDRFFGDQVDGALDARIDDEGLVGVMADGLDHRFDIGADKIERRLDGSGVLGISQRHGAERAYQCCCDAQTAPVVSP